MTGGGDTSVASATVTTTPFTVGAESNRVLIAIVFWISPDETLNGVTWDIGSPQSFTACDAVFTSGNSHMRAWYLVNPTGATDTVTATFSGSAIGTQGVAAALFSGAHQTVPCTNWTTATGTSATPALIAISAATDNDYLMDCVRNDSFNDLYTPGAGQTEIFQEAEIAWSRQDGSESDDIMSGSLLGSAGWVMGGVRIAAAGGGAAPKGRLLLLGVGDEETDR